RPLKAPALTWPARVHSANSNSPTSRGSTKWASRRLDAEGRVRALERLQQPLQPGQRGVGEAGAHTTRVHEAGPLPVTDQQGSGKASPLTLALHPAADDELLAQAALDLLPGPGAPALFVGAVGAVGQCPLQP